MAALVKVNSLEAYALLDTGSTAILISHDFARVAKLKVFQLENPIPLQPGMVGSRSMINFGARSCVELGVKASTGLDSTTCTKSELGGEYLKW